MSKRLTVNGIDAHQAVHEGAKVGRGHAIDNDSFALIWWEFELEHFLEDARNLGEVLRWANA